MNASLFLDLSQTRHTPPDGSVPSRLRTRTPAAFSLVASDNYGTEQQLTDVIELLVGAHSDIQSLHRQSENVSHIQERQLEHFRVNIEYLDELSQIIEGRKKFQAS